MFCKKTIEAIKTATEELRKARLELAKETKEAKHIAATLESARKQHGILLLDDLNEELIKKLQDLEDDSTVIIFTQNDRSRIEIKRNDVYTNKRHGIY